MEKDDSFEYTYSAPEQEEIRMIREKYIPRDERETKMERLRRLDAGVTKKGTTVSLVVGILSALIMGGGMSLCMVGPAEYFIPGILVGCVGMVGMALAHPLYSHITAKERERITPEILRLTDELM